MSVLRTCGNSMIDVGIKDGDLVVGMWIFIEILSYMQ